MNYGAILLCSGLTTLLSILLSANLIIKHAKNWTSPAQQTNIIKIILLAPIFALDSFVGILELEKGETVAHVLDMVKECYEAVAINAFLMLMYSLCGLDDHTKKRDKSIAAKSVPGLPDGVKGREIHVPFPLGLHFKHARLDEAWLGRLRSWTVQFLLLRPVLSLVDLLFVDLMPHPIVSPVLSTLIGVVLNASVTTAVLALITFYHAFETELALYRPLAKFVCIKGVVFFAMWQGVALKLMVRFGVLNEGYRFSADEVALAWQDLLVCVEMGLIFCPLHLYAFPAREYYQKKVETTKKIN